MKFAHMADCHLGGWRDDKLTELGQQSFEKAMDICLQKQVDFVIIAGDLFNTAIPPIDSTKHCVNQLKRLQNENIPVYCIAGSHDFSPSGKTMLDVLEGAGLLINVGKGQEAEGNLILNFTTDKKTGVKLTGIPGKRAGLDKTYYEQLDRAIEQEPGYKIFLFHCVIDELKTKKFEKVDGMSTSLMPKNFDYYAGGHVHIVKKQSIEGYKQVVYPGPLFPNNFSELEELKQGGFYIVEDDQLTFEPVQIKKVESLEIDANQKSPEEITQEIKDASTKIDATNAIITIRIAGTLQSGKPSDIDLKKIYEELYNNKAHMVMKNTNAVKTKDYEEIKIEAASIETVEENLIREHASQSNLKTVPKEQLANFTKGLMQVLQTDKEEGEKVNDFEMRVKREMDKTIQL
ncbi:MAG: exonuclease SbcCD subunit D [Nanoarchaeota archaeon]|nr:exonuclease SbcCD subunit D [Nanoarchaeota archaeon]